MAEYMTLMGAENVQRAGYVISEAADRIGRAAERMDEAVSRLERIMDETVSRAERVLASFSEDLVSIQHRAEELERARHG